MITIETYARKTFTVEAVQVTAENMGEVAAWCSGSIRSIDSTLPGSSTYIEVRVILAGRVQKAMAYDGDWVTKTNKSYKVYRDKSFNVAFEPVDTNKFEHVFKIVHETLAELDTHDTVDVSAMITSKLIKMLQA